MQSNSDLALATSKNIRRDLDVANVMTDEDTAERGEVLLTRAAKNPSSQNVFLFQMTPLLMREVHLRAQDK